jgi:outer membrane receptor protein involved in Fe transport
MRWFQKSHWHKFCSLVRQLIYTLNKVIKQPFTYFILLKIYIMQKKILLLFSLIFSISTIYSQTGKIEGSTIENTSNQTIKDVIISIENSGNFQISDSLGHFSFSGLLAGQYEISFTKFGYKAQKIISVLNEGETKSLAIQLLFSSILLSGVDITSYKPISAASSQFLTAVDFENRPKNSAQDMLRLVPGLFIAQHAGGGKAEQIFIRGFDCDHGTDIASFVDGIPVNMPSHGHGQGYMDLHFLIPETVKDMTVVKGPYSPQFGNFATGGAVQFNTADTLSNNLFQLDGSVASNVNGIMGTRALAMYQLPKLNNHLSSYAAIDILNNKGYFESPQDFNRMNLFSKTVFQINPQQQVSFTASGFNSSWNASGQIPDRAVKNNLISRMGSLDNTEGGSTSRNNLNFKYASKTLIGEFNAQYFHSRYQFKLFSNFTFFLNDSINGDQIEQNDNRTVQGINSSYTIPFNTGKVNHRFTFGSNLRSDDIDNSLWSSIKRERLNAKAIAKIREVSTGLYFNEAIQFNPQWRLELGARYDYFTFNVEDQIPSDSSRKNYSGYNYQTGFFPKANLVYSPIKNLQLFANVGSGYHSNDARSSVQALNQHQLPKSLGVELGTLARIGNRFVVSMALWRLDLENELVFVGDEGTTENNGASNRMGIDISIRYQINPYFFADADVNISKNTLRNKFLGQQLKADFNIPLAPTFTSTGGLGFKNNFIEASARYRYLADRAANEANTVIAKGYNVIDLSLVYTLKKCRFGLSIENLLNTKWNEAQFDTESKLRNENTSISELHFTPGTPFTGKLSVGYRF